VSSSEAFLEIAAIVLTLRTRTHSNSASDAQDSLSEQLHIAVEQILESNRAISVQLRELIAQRSPNDDVAFDTTNANLVTSDPSPDSAEFMPTSPTTTSSSDGSWRTSLFAKDRGDAASIRSTATTASMRSFKEALRTSPVYKRLRRKGRDSDSVFSVESSEKGCAWSMLSDRSLGELSISEISVIELPICLSDLWDPAPYRVESASTVTSRRKSSTKAKWSSRGRIHNAIDAGNDYVVRMLLNLGADVEEIDREGHSPLAHACFKNGEAFVMLLLEKGADLESRDNQGRTPLALTAVGGYGAVAKLLLENGSYPESRDSQGRTPLALAAVGERPTVDLAKFLLEKGANVESRDNEGKTPLAHAFLHERDSIVKLLLEKAASVDSLKAIGLATDLNGGLKTAVKEGKETVVRMLLSMGADLESRDSESRTPLAQAVLYEHESIVKLLLEKGASVDALKAIGTTTDVSGRLETAIFYGRENVVRLLLMMGADVEERGTYERTPLLDAAYQGKLTFVKILVEAGADMNARAKDGWTVLHLAAYRGDAELVQFLLENGARDLLDFSRDDGYTPLHFAADHNNLPVAQVLVERGARLDLKNNNRQTPYQLARHGSPVAKYLWSQLSPDEQRAATTAR
jgi:ankyrin repeat protein